MLTSRCITLLLLKSVRSYTSSIVTLGSPEKEPPDDSAPSPLDDVFVDFLMSKKRESSELDFKLTIDVSREQFAAIAKDIFAIANYGGGYILVGFKEKESGSFEPIGLPPDFHIDQADLQQKFNAYVSEPIVVGYREFDFKIEESVRRFALIHVPPAIQVLVPTRGGIITAANGRARSVFSPGDVLVRRGTQSIAATPTEIKEIRSRAEEGDIRTSLVSGNPDRIRETLFSNLFGVVKVPKSLFSARVAVERVPYNSLDVPLLVQYPYIYTFADLGSERFRGYVRETTIRRERTGDWLGVADLRNFLLRLLNSTILWEGERRGLLASGRQLFYPLRPGETERIESWPGLTRESPRSVAATMYARQLGASVGIHPAVDVQFLIIGDNLFLKLAPSIVLTSDGRHVRRGTLEGNVITSLLHDEYNNTYLRNLFFWMSKLSDNEGRLRFLDGELEVESLPVKTSIECGLRSDSLNLPSSVRPHD